MGWKVKDYSRSIEPRASEIDEAFLLAQLVAEITFNSFVFLSFYLWDYDKGAESLWPFTTLPSNESVIW